MEIQDFEREDDKYFSSFSGPGNSLAIQVPRSVFPSIALGSPSVGSVKLQFTYSTLSRIKDDTATWFDWDQGDVLANSSKFGYIYPQASAVRAVASNQAATYVFEMVG